MPRRGLEFFWLGIGEITSTTKEEGRRKGCNSKLMAQSEVRFMVPLLLPSIWLVQLRSFRIFARLVSPELKLNQGKGLSERLYFEIDGT